MKLFDILCDALALIADDLTVWQQLAFRRVRRGARDSTGDVALAVRRPHALFRLPLFPRSLSDYPDSDGVKDLTMKLFDLPYDALALIVAELTVRQQLAFRRVCRGARDLTAGAAMAVRLANALARPSKSSGSISGYQPSDGVMETSESSRGSGINGVELHIQKTADARALYGQKDLFTRARISCTGFEHSSSLAVEVDLVLESSFNVPVTRRRAEKMCAELELDPEEWRESFAQVLKEFLGERKWHADTVGLRFEVSAEGNIAAVSVAFRRGFAGRRAGQVGKVLGEVLKGVDARKARLLTQRFAMCEHFRKGSFSSQPLPQHDGGSEEVQSIPNGDARVVSFEEFGMRVVTRPRHGPQNMHVDITVLCRSVKGCSLLFASCVV